MAGLDRALPAAWYLGQEAFERERDRLLYREWFCVGRLDQGERPGSPVVVEVAGESVLVRTRAGELAAHYNVCRHRGSQVVPCPPAQPGLPQATPVRKAGSLRCPYHSWTYRLQGDLLRAPWSEEIDGFDQAAFGLHPVGWRPGAGSCSCTSRRPRPSPWPTSSARCPSGCAATRWPTWWWGGGSSTGSGPTGSWSPRTTTSATTAPASTPSCAGWGRRSSAAGPGWTRETTVVCELLFHPDERARPGFDPSDAADFWDLLNHQDWAMCESVQRGMASRASGCGWFAPMEQPSLDIRRYIVERVGPVGEEEP